MANSEPTGEIIIIGQAKIGETLSADTSKIRDNDGLTQFSYQWLRDGVVIENSDQATYQLKDADLGKKISVAVFYLDGADFDEYVESSQTQAVQQGVVTNVNHKPTGSVTISGVAEVGQTLTASNTIADADGMGVGYVWYYTNNVMNVYVTKQPTYTLTASDVGKSFYVKAYYTDLKGNYKAIWTNKTNFVTATQSNPIEKNSIVGSWSYDDDTSNGIVTLSQDGTFVLDAKSTDPDGAKYGEYTGTERGTYEWDSVTGDFTADVTSDTNGKLGLSYYLYYSGGTIPVAISGDTMNFGDGEVILSRINTPATPDNTEVTNHLRTGELTIIGDAKVGKTLTADVSQIKDADGLGEFYYLWFGDGDELDSTNESTYQLTNADIGKKISVSVLYLDGADYDEEISSGETAVVKAAVSGVTKTGDAKANKLDGTAYDDSLSGLAGNDTLLGKAGNDSLNGGDGTDSLTGGFDFDALTGDKGADKFIFTDINDAPISKLGIEVIKDFNHNEKDKIVLSTIDADTTKAGNQAFSSPVVGAKFSGTFTKTGQLFFDTTSHILHGNVNQDSGADFAIQLNGVSSLVASDFML